MRDIHAAVIQMCAGPEPDRSLKRAAELTEEALDRGADLVVLPENFWGVAPPGFDRLAWAADLQGLGPDGDLAGEPPPVLAAQLAVSRRSDAVIVLGGLPERPAPRDGAGAGTIFNTLVALWRGKLVATYRKIHRFDATLPDGSTLLESATVAAGQHPTVLTTPAACLGLSICYDLRFPELYRALAAAGAEVLLVPAAFTLLTGIDHWEPLLRARAIENQAFVLAPAQQGVHGHGRHSFGHSLIIDPWGAVIAQASRGDGVAMAHLRAGLLDRVRADLPVLGHRRLLGENNRDPTVVAPGVGMNVAQPGLAALMDRYLDGDERAFGQLHAALTPRLRGLLGKLVRDTATAEDLLQATLLKAHLAREGFVVRGPHPDAAVQAWYATIARNLALDHLRGQVRERRRRVDGGEERDLMQEIATDLPSVEEWQVDRDTAAEITRRVHEALAQLPAAQREVVELHKLAGLSMAEISERLQIREGAVRVRAHRAYKALARVLGPGLFLIGMHLLRTGGRA